MRMMLDRRGWVRGGRKFMNGMNRFRDRGKVRGQPIKCDGSGIG